MYFFFIIILILLSVDYIVFNETKKYINKKYRKTLNLLNRYNPLYKFEIKRSNDSFLMRMLILALFWVSINFTFIIIKELKTWNLDSEILNGFKFFENYKYFIIPTIGLFVYFGIHIYSKSNSYIRTIDMIIGIIPSLFITFIS